MEATDGATAPITIHLPEILYKYREWDKKGRTREMLEKGTFHFPSPDKFNDPFDCAIEPTFDGPQRDLFDRGAESYAAVIGKDVYTVRKEMQRSFRKGKLTLKKMKSDGFRVMKEHSKVATGILSLSANPTSLLMWSHYAASHTGICIGLSAKRLLEALQADHDNGPLTIGLQPVVYEANYPDLPYFAELGEDHTLHLRKTLSQIFVTKSNDWEYEKEYRALMFRKDGANLRDGDRNRIYPNVIREVILGLNSWDHEREIRKVIDRKKGVILNRVMKVPGSFAIEIVNA